MKAQSAMKLKLQGNSSLTVTTAGVLEPINNMVMAGSPSPFGDQTPIQSL
jgi:hypothetical protein